MNGFRHHSKLVLPLLVVVFALLFFAPAHAQESSNMTEDEAAHQEAVIRSGEALAQGNDELLAEYIAEDYVVHSPFGEMGRDDLSALFAAFRGAFTDFQVMRENMVLQDDYAAMRTIATGVFENDFNGPMGVIPPNGQPIRVELINIFHFNEEGLIDEEWVQFDNMNFLTQIGAVPATESESEAALSEEAMATFIEQFDAFFDGGPNLEIIDEMFAPEFVSHLPLAPELDREAFKAYVVSFYEGVPDLTQEVNQVIVTEDRLIVHVTYNGTHTGTLFGVPATGNPISMNGIGIFSFNEDGLAVENWAVLDMVGVLAQISAFPPTPAE